MNLRPASLDNPIELAGDTAAGERVVDNLSQALPTEIIDDSEHAELPAACQRD